MSTELHWQVLLKEAVTLYLNQACDPSSGTQDTPARVVRAWAEFASGYMEDPTVLLRRSFDDIDGHDSMVHIWRIPIRSTCEHHLMSFYGLAHFAYVPDKIVVGLSKVPRFIDILCRRLQIQERLTEQIVNIFQQEVKPLGCAVQITATHTCTCNRGIRASGVMMTTTGLRGAFKANDSTRMEFLMARPSDEVLG